MALNIASGLLVKQVEKLVHVLSAGTVCSINQNAQNLIPLGHVFNSVVFKLFYKLGYADGAWPVNIQAIPETFE